MSIKNSSYIKENYIMDLRDKYQRRIHEILDYCIYEGISDIYNLQKNNVTYYKEFFNCLGAVEEYEVEVEDGLQLILAQVADIDRNNLDPEDEDIKDELRSNLINKLLESLTESQANSYDHLAQELLDDRWSDYERVRMEEIIDPMKRILAEKMSSRGSDVSPKSIDYHRQMANKIQRTNFIKSRSH